jgi:hypothetical protein
MSLKQATPPKGYVKLNGSERHPAKEVKLIGPSDETEVLQVTIVLRRRIDGPKLPDFDYYRKVPPNRRKKLSPDEFAAKHGAHPDDVDKVTSFVENAGLTVVNTHLGRRHVVVSGTVSAMSEAFAVPLGRYEVTAEHYTASKFPLKKETYRGRDGSIYIPAELAPLLIGIFGLDNRDITQRAAIPADPQITRELLISQVKELYNFPRPGVNISGQTIAIASPTSNFGGYLQTDLDAYFSSIGMNTPNICPIIVDDATNAALIATTSVETPAGTDTLFVNSAVGVVDYTYGLLVFGGISYRIAVYQHNVQDKTISAIYLDPVSNTYIDDFKFSVPAGAKVYLNIDQEITQDICIAGSTASGATIAVYFSPFDSQGWIDLIGRVIFPEHIDFLSQGFTIPSVLSSSFFLKFGDDSYAFENSMGSISASTLTAIDMALQDAAAAGITICFATGDQGSACNDNDSNAHVYFPPSDPWVLSVGGTTLGEYLIRPAVRRAPVEYIWNDSFFTPVNHGATGGGVSSFFPLPSYQLNAGVPKNINIGANFYQTGRGLPDVAGNASPNSGYNIYWCGTQVVANGTSASTPLWAGLIAIINSNLGFDVGFINPFLYTLGPGAFNPINPLYPDPEFPQLADCPADNGFNGVKGYPATAGWDACTGLGSPNGNAILKAFQTWIYPHVYILGGYQSPSIIFTDPDSMPPNQPVPLGGVGHGPLNTVLQPDHQYGFSVIVRNDSSIPVNDLEVRFWVIPMGLGIDGYLVGEPQIVDIHPYSTLIVKASAPFISPNPHQQACAAVSLYNPAGDCTVQALAALEIPDPGVDGSHGCSAWRNTQSMTNAFGNPFGIPLGLHRIPPRPFHHVVIRVTATHIPFNWQQQRKVSETQNVLNALGVQNNTPLYVLPNITQNFAEADLAIKLVAGAKNQVEEVGIYFWQVLPPADEKDPFSINITGQIPRSANIGDIYIVKVSAQYPEMDGRQSRTVSFYTYIEVV